MTRTWLTISALALSLGATSGGFAARAYAAQEGAPPPPGYQQGDGRWNEPPSEYREVQRQGFHDGMEAAEHDYEARSHKDADDHDRYRHPPVEREFRSDYRNAFREGYSRAMRHVREERRDREYDAPHS